MAFEIGEVELATELMIDNTVQTVSICYIKELEEEIVSIIFFVKAVTAMKQKKTDSIGCYL